MKLILVPIDFSADSINALEHGILFANIIKADLRMIHVNANKDFKAPSFFKDLDDFNGKSVEDYFKLIKYRHQRKLHKNLDYVIKQGNISEEIIQQAEKDKVGFIIMGTHGLSDSDSHWMGSNAYKVVSNSFCPVLTIRNGFIRKTVTKIVLPIDASKNTRRKLTTTAKIAKVYDAEIHVIGVTETGMKDILQKVESWVKQSVEYLNKSKIKNKSLMVQGSDITAMTIDYAKSINADLISIMTEQGEDAVSLLLSPYAQQMVNNSPIPVLTIRNNK